MKKAMLVTISILSICLLSLACSEDEELVFPTKILKGSVGGCQIENYTDNIRVGLMGVTEDMELIEVASTDIDPVAPQFTMSLEATPPESLQWVTEEDGVTRHVELLVYSYLDDGSGSYDSDDDGEVIGVCATRIHFFDAAYENLGADFGYNVLDTEGGGFSSGFTENFYVTAGGCEDGDEVEDELPADGDEPEIEDPELEE